MKKYLFLILMITASIGFSQSVDGPLKTLLCTSVTDTYVVSEAAPAAYNSKERFLIRFTTGNTGSATLNRNSLGAISILNNGVALATGDIVGGQEYLMAYDGTNYQCLTCKPVFKGTSTSIGIGTSTPGTLNGTDNSAVIMTHFKSAGGFNGVFAEVAGTPYYGLANTAAGAGLKIYIMYENASGDLIFSKTPDDFSVLQDKATLTAAGNFSAANILSSTYTPTLNNTTNVAASTAYVTGYFRIGDAVTVFGKVSIDATLAASTATELGISLPIASNLAAEEDLGGNAISDAVASLTARIKADATNDRASVVFKALSLNNDSYSFEFSYQVK